MKKKCNHKWQILALPYIQTVGKTEYSLVAVCTKCLKNKLVSQ